MPSVRRLTAILAADVAGYSRLMGAANTPPGSARAPVSNTVYDHLRDRLPFVFEDLGEQRVKNIARPVRVYRVPAAAAKSPLRQFRRCCRSPTSRRSRCCPSPI
jgi:class 3 adenylate cyclase